jgi:hypothetical protein
MQKTVRLTPGNCVISSSMLPREFAVSVHFVEPAISALLSMKVPVPGKSSVHEIP